MKKMIVIFLMVLTIGACKQPDQSINKTLNQPVVNTKVENTSVGSTNVILLEEISTETPAEDICDENNVSDECLYGVQ
jgi:hypothetical protein